jgi:hypothetical protein
MERGDGGYSPTLRCSAHTLSSRMAAARSERPEHHVDRRWEAPFKIDRRFVLVRWSGSGT